MALLRHLKPILVVGLLGAALVVALVLGSAARSNAASIPHAPVSADNCIGSTSLCP
jgi:hypothetical protein